MWNEAWYVRTGDVLGAGMAVITFLGVYAAAVGSVGWVIGIALGWIPAVLAGALGYQIIRWLWLPLLAAIGLVVLNVLMR